MAESPITVPVDELHRQHDARLKLAADWHVHCLMQSGGTDHDGVIARDEWLQAEHVLAPHLPPSSGIIDLKTMFNTSLRNAATIVLTTNQTRSQTSV